MTRDLIKRQQTNKIWRENNTERLREYFLDRSYGITPEIYEMMAASQHGTCAMPFCSKDLSDKATGAVIDHDHVTGTVRGILCRQHNLALGKFGDNSEFLRQAAQYLEGKQADGKSKFILMASGKKFYPLAPRLQDIDVEDAALALSQICRFLGHTRSFYSIAEHSVRVSQHVEEEYALWGLLHDLSEGWLNDVPSPLKYTELFRPYLKIEEATMRLVAKKFSLSWPMPEAIHIADKRMLATETRDLFTNWTSREKLSEPYLETIVPWAPKKAHTKFMARYKELTG